jgi:hypothetical protein
MDMDRNKWLLRGVIALVLLLVIGGIAWWMYATREEAQEIASGQTMYTPQEGRVVAKFPGELILEDGPQIVKSYRIEYTGDSVSHPFVRYASGKSFAENVDLFTKFFQGGGWETLRWGNVAETPATFFQSAKSGNEVNVILKEEEGKVEVSIAYTLNP